MDVQVCVIAHRSPVALGKDSVVDSARGRSIARRRQRCTKRRRVGCRSAAVTYFCAGFARPLRPQEMTRRHDNGVERIAEIDVGYDGVAVATGGEAPFPFGQIKPLAHSRFFPPNRCAGHVASQAGER